MLLPWRAPSRGQWTAHSPRASIRVAGGTGGYTL